MIRFHMMDHNAVQLPAVQQMLKILKEYFSDSSINSIKQNRFFIEKEIRIIGNSVRNPVNSLKHRKTAVV